MSDAIRDTEPDPAPLENDAPRPVDHHTRAERVARGKAARAAVPRRSLGVFEAAADRPDPISLLESQAATRVPELIPVRYGRMAVSPFTFFRGAALGMAQDLSTSPTSGLRVQACGDAHLSNFGGFATPERELAFDINDFDETLPGPWEWDVKRLVASMEIAGRDNGFSAADCRAVVLETAMAYRKSMQALAEMTMFDVWNAKLDITQVVVAARKMITSSAFKQASQTLAKARTRDSMQAFKKLTTIVDGQPQIVSDPPLVVTIRDMVHNRAEAELTERIIHAALRGYRATLQSDRRHLLEQFQVVDVARKVVGVGSVGTRCWIVLLTDANGDPLFLQVKQAEPSVLARFVGASRYRNQGARVVAGQRLMQSASDIFLGWHQITGVDGVARDFYFRQLRDWKVSATIETMKPPGMKVYAVACAWVLAKGHARSGDGIAIASYIGNGEVFDNAMADFASAYADQNERDHAALLAAIKSGRVEAEMGV